MTQEIRPVYRTRQAQEQAQQALQALLAQHDQEQVALEAKKAAEAQAAVELRVAQLREELAVKHQGQRLLVSFHRGLQTALPFLSSKKTSRNSSDS